MNNFLVGLLFIYSFSIKAQDSFVFQVKDLQNQNDWVENQLKKMNVKQKIGQLFMIAAYGKKDSKQFRKIKKLIKKYYIGGIIFMKGEPLQQVHLTNKFQKMAKTPLFIAIDAEWGLDMRLKHTFRFPWNMTLGAIKESILLEKLGKRLAVHSKRMGIHINFAPVVDININPKNPIIGNRSFGEDKHNVFKRSLAIVKGLQSENIMACAKHFPGHGDTQSDSHWALPKLDFDLKRLQNVELYPYRKLFEKGLASVMVAHLNIPALDKNAQLPTSLSYDVVTNLLQRQMKFKGLVFTDGLNMKAVTEGKKPGQVALEAFLAGNDILLIPKDPTVAIKALQRAFKKKQFTMQRLNRSVEKILKAKYWAGLHNQKEIGIENVIEDLNTSQDKALKEKLVENSMTLIQNRKNTFPVYELRDKKFAYLHLGGASGEDFFKTLQKYTKVQRVQKTDIATIEKQLKGMDCVFVGYHAFDKTPWTPYHFSREDIAILNTISQKHKVILSVFASPYSLSKIKNFDNIESILVAYQNSFTTQSLAAQAIFGALPTRGKLPVSIGKKFPVGVGLTPPILGRLSYGHPAAVGMSYKHLQRIDTLMQRIILDTIIPGGQVLVARYGKVVYHKSYGYHTYEKKQKVRNSDLYDLASLTKILAGLPLMLKAYNLGLLTLKTTWAQLFPKFKNSNKDTLTVQQIFSHKARLQSWIPFYKQTIDSITQKPLAKYYSHKKTKAYNIHIAKDLYLLSSYRDSIYKKIIEAPQRERDTYGYSGLVFYMMYPYAKNNFQKPLDSLLQDGYYKPLGMTTLTFNPLRKFEAARIVPSEIDDYYRGQKLQGYVHDMGAAMMDGVSANAGLFANANDVAKMMQLYLQKGLYGGERYFTSHTFDVFNHRYYEKDSIRRGLILDKPQINPEEKATCSCVSEESFGHSGFTGTYAWADPKTQTIYVFLSNRTYPSMQNNKLSELDIRTKIHSLVMQAIK